MAHPSECTATTAYARPVGHPRMTTACRCHAERRAIHTDRTPAANLLQNSRCPSQHAQLRTTFTWRIVPTLSRLCGVDELRLPPTVAGSRSGCCSSSPPWPTLPWRWRLKRSSVHLRHDRSEPAGGIPQAKATTTSPTGMELKTHHGAHPRDRQLTQRLHKLLIDDQLNRSTAAYPRSRA